MFCFATTWQTNHGFTRSKILPYDIHCCVHSISAVTRTTERTSVFDEYLAVGEEFREQVHRRGSRRGPVHVPE